VVPPPSGELDINALLETARKDPAYRDLSTEELFLQVTQKLYSALKADKEKEASGKTQPAESNKVLQAKEWIYADCFEAYICRYKGKNYYYADNLRDQNKFCQPISLKVGTNREAALVKARELYRERGSLQARGIFNKSITTKELFDLYLKDQSYRIHKETKTGLIQKSYDAKLQRLKYWIRFIESLGYKNKKIEQIPPSVGRKYKDWIYKEPKERYKDRPRDIHTINAIIGAAKAMYKFALDEKHIGYDDTPQFEYFDSVVEDDKIKRSVLHPREWKQLLWHMKGKYWHQDAIDHLPPAKLQVCRQFVWYIILQYETGARMKELDDMRWKQITEPAHVHGAMADLNKDFYIPQSKTRRKRTFTTNATHIINGIKQVHKDCGIPYDPEGRVFVKIENTPKLDEWFGRESIQRFLKKMLKECGLQEKLNAEFPKRNITLNSARHFFATRAIVEWGWDYKLTSAHMGNSAQEIEYRYSKHTANMLAGERMKTIGTNQIAERQMLNPDGTINQEATKRFKRELQGLEVKPVQTEPAEWEFAEGELTDEEALKLLNDSEDLTGEEAVKLLQDFVDREDAKRSGQGEKP
tara:strand:+ start:771 stop:2522 length:1752 start_codon:yes stop_codon:yes gene_type:complete